MIWKVALGIAGALFLVALLFAHARRRNPLDLTDMLRDRSTGKASLNAFILLTMSLLSCVCVIAGISREWDVTNLLLGVLGIFVLQRGVTQTVDTIKGPPPTPDKTGSTSTKETTIETRTMT